MNAGLKEEEFSKVRKSPWVFTVKNMEMVQSVSFSYGVGCAHRWNRTYQREYHD